VTYLQTRLTIAAGTDLQGEDTHILYWCDPLAITTYAKCQDYFAGIGNPCPPEFIISVRSELYHRLPPTDVWHVVDLIMRASMDQATPGTSSTIEPSTPTEDTTNRVHRPRRPRLHQQHSRSPRQRPTRLLHRPLQPTMRLLPRRLLRPPRQC
jgi:hypothetical protein